MTDSLEAIHDGRRVGRLHDEGGRIRFVYAEDWQSRADAFPVSLSMPLVGQEYPDSVVRPFISGLLPDHDEVLKRWGQKFHVSPRNPFRMLFHIGEECAGGIQFVPSGEVEKWLGGSPPGGVDWLDPTDFVGRIEDLVQDGSQARRMADEGQFSLAGAQAKTALLRDFETGTWGIPRGVLPTTHIIKPNRGEFEDFEINEHFCLQLANRLGLRAARSWTETIGKVRAIIVERYDRQRHQGRYIRVHQEDCCQALGVPPERKYENEGGPSAKRLFDLIREGSSRPGEDIRCLLDALVFNYLIGGTDAHSKNFSLLIAGGGQIRLAPLYDLISILCYRHQPQKLKLAMKIGGDYLLRKIGPHHWEKAAAEWRLGRDDVCARVVRLAGSMERAVAEVTKTLTTEEKAVARIIPELSERIVERSHACLQEFKGA